MRCENCQQAKIVKDGRNKPADTNKEVVLCCYFDQYRSANFERECYVYAAKSCPTAEKQK